MNDATTPPKRGLLSRIGRWFSWRKKRFWLITLPVRFVAAIVVTLVILFQIPGLERRELKIGSWVVAAVAGEDVDDLWKSRSVRLGPLGIQVHHFGPGERDRLGGFDWGKMSDWGRWTSWSSAKWLVYLKTGGGKMIGR